MYDRIKKALAPLKIPVYPFFYGGKDSAYIVIHNLSDHPAQSADNTEIITGYYLQIDFVAKRDMRATADKAMPLLESAGFRRAARHEEYDQPSGTYRVCVRFTTYEEVYQPCH